jgi:hypothetical protein
METIRVLKTMEAMILLNGMEVMYFPEAISLPSFLAISYKLVRFPG